MWHTNFVGDSSLYDQAARRVRFKLAGRNIHLADFSITGRLNYRNDSEPNDGIVSAGCADSSVSNGLAGTHQGGNLDLQRSKPGHRRLPLSQHSRRWRESLRRHQRNRHTELHRRGTGDDCFAIWPAASDQGFVGHGPAVGWQRHPPMHGPADIPRKWRRDLRRGQQPNRGLPLHRHRHRDAEFSSARHFPTSDEKLKIDNNFSGTTLVRNCELLRCGGYDHSWAWRGSLQICMDRRSISGLTISGVTIRDSISSGITIVGPGSPKGEGTLSDARLRAW
jgi:hypothetical protein